MPFPVRCCLKRGSLRLAVMVAMTLTLPRGANGACADLALVLAIDGSGSIDDAEFRLQQLGYAGAFRSPQVKDALQQAGQVEVSAVIWGDSEMTPQILGWHRIESPADADRFAAALFAMPRKVTGDTGIGSGLFVALDLLQPDADCTTRHVINLSGDGRGSQSPRARHAVPLKLARDRADRLGVTINALAIAMDDPDLREWYDLHVITGPGAFVMQVGAFDDFADAILVKLVREIAPLNVADNDSNRHRHPSGSMADRARSVQQWQFNDVSGHRIRPTKERG